MAVKIIVGNKTSIEISLKNIFVASQTCKQKIERWTWKINCFGWSNIQPINFCSRKLLKLVKSDWKNWDNGIECRVIKPSAQWNKLFIISWTVWQFLMFANVELPADKQLPSNVQDQGS